MKLFKNILLCCLTLASFGANAQDVVATAAPSGVWLNYEQAFDARATYTVSRKTDNGDWEEMDKISPVANFEEFKARLYKTTVYAEVNDIPSDTMQMHIWERYRQYRRLDSIGVYSTYLPVLQALGAAWYDASAKGGSYQYKVSNDAGKAFTSAPVKYPAVKTEVGKVRPDKIQPVINGVYLEFEVLDRGTMQAVHVYRSYYLRSGFERIYPDVLFNSTGGKLSAVFTDYTAVKGVPYGYMLVPVDAAGNEGVPSDWMKLFNMPANTIKPSVTGIRANSVEEKKAIKISWDQLEEKDIVSVEVYKSKTRTGVYQRIASLNPSDTVFFDHHVKPILTYYYTVCLNGVFEQSVNSARVPGTLKASYKNYIAPQHVSAEMEGDKARLQWDRVEDDTRGYFVYRGEGYKGKMVKVSGIILSDSNTVVWYDTIPGTRPGIYTYAITSENTSYSESPLSTAVSVQNNNTVTLPIVKHINVIPDTAGRLRVLWDDLFAASAMVDGYTLYRRSTDDADNEIEKIKIIAAFIPRETNRFVDADVKEGVTYIYSVEAISGDLKGSASLEAGYTIPVNYPLQVNDIQAYTSNGEVQLQWMEPQGQPIQKIHLLKAESGKKPEIFASIEPGIDSYVDKKVDKGTLYHYYFVTENKKGVNSKPTSAVSITCK